MCKKYICYIIIFLSFYLRVGEVSNSLSKIYEKQRNADVFKFFYANGMKIFSVMLENFKFFTFPIQFCTQSNCILKNIRFTVHETIQN